MAEKQLLHATAKILPHRIICLTSISFFFSIKRSLKTKHKICRRNDMKIKNKQAESNCILVEMDCIIAITGAAMYINLLNRTLKQKLR